MDVERNSDYKIPKLRRLLNEHCSREIMTYVAINKKPSK
jgi:hypothetical protein